MVTRLACCVEGRVPLGLEVVNKAHTSDEEHIVELLFEINQHVLSGLQIYK